MYGRESSFGIQLGKRGSPEAAGHFQLRSETAKRYGLTISRNNDQRFDIDYASSAAARYLKDLDTMFSKKTTLLRGTETIPVKNASERKKFALGAYNGGEGRIAAAQRLTEKAGNNPQLWSDVQEFLKLAGATESKAKEIRQYVELVPSYELEFAQKSSANKALKHKEAREEKPRCTTGHWVTIDDRPVFICE